MVVSVCVCTYSVYCTVWVCVCVCVCMCVRSEVAWITLLSLVGTLLCFITIKVWKSRHGIESEGEQQWDGEGQAPELKRIFIRSFLSSGHEIKPDTDWNHGIFQLNYLNHNHNPSSDITCHLYANQITFSRSPTYNFHFMIYEFSSNNYWTTAKLFNCPVEYLAVLHHITLILLVNLKKQYM